MRAVIFSKDRPAQLELLVRSLKEQIREQSSLSIAVLYAASNSGFGEGYERFRSLHPEVELSLQVKDRPIKAQIASLVERERREFFTFFTDDIVIIRPVAWTDHPFNVLRRQQDVVSVSLRLNPRVSFCQPLNLAETCPPLDDDLTWDYRSPTSRWLRLARAATGYPYPKGDWAGAMFIDGYIFRHDQFVPYFSALPEFSHVTHIESVMLRNPLPGRRVVCYPESRLVNLVLNRVDTQSQYPHAGGSPGELNSRFLSGEVLDYEKLKGLHNTSCHIAVEPDWTTRSNLKSSEANAC
ncbi:MAG: hypothetical protein JST54_08060 [Deltaproteobacteria bacterium]|nr:hypothetical protein [Deltaproteobacteria bacterium]